MRRVTHYTVHAFIDGRSKTVGNTNTSGKTLWLHGNRIAWKGFHEGVAGIFLTLAGWNTSTTRDRLNGVLTVMGHKRVQDGDLVLGIFQHKHEPFIGHHTVGSLDEDDTRTVEIGASQILFVAHPCFAKGLDAVTLLSGSR